MATFFAYKNYINSTLTASALSMKFAAMDRKYWLRIVGVFCISCSSLLAHVEGNGEEGEEEEGAPEAIANPLQLVLWGVDDVKWGLNMGVIGTLCFAEGFVKELIRNERFGIPPAGRVLLEDTWDRCLHDFAEARKSLVECIEKLDAVVALTQAVRSVANEGSDHVAEAQQDYLDLHEAYRRQHGASLQQMMSRELGFVPNGE
jgi:hypothetical protein